MATTFEFGEIERTAFCLSAALIILRYSGEAPATRKLPKLSLSSLRSAANSFNDSFINSLSNCSKVICILFFLIRFV